MSDARTRRDLVEADMAEHQRRHSGEVTADQNARLAAEALAQYDREQADAPPIAPEPPKPLEHTATKRELNGHTYVLDVSPEDDSSFRRSTEWESLVLAHAQPRIDLLLSKPDEGPLGQPSWRTRALASLYFKVKALEAVQSGRPDEARVYERAFQQDLYEVLEASNQVFGDWRKDKSNALIVGAR